jgi:hypothetical protein
MPENKKPKVIKANEEETFSNKARTVLGMDPLPKPKVLDTGFAASRLKKKGYK